MTIRNPEYGRQGWYPLDPEECRGAIEEFVAGRPVPADPPGSLHGGIAPHAGWRYSGPVAAPVFLALSGQKPDTVVVYGHHLEPGGPTAVMAGGGWRTPLGVLHTDEELAGALGEMPGVAAVPADRFRTDNTIELQLPFVAYFFPGARILVAGAAPDDSGRALAEGVAAAADRLGRRIVAVGSTDLTHYGPNYGFEPHGRGEAAVRWVKEVQDPRAVERMIALDPEGLIAEALQSGNACCPGAAAAAIRTGARLGARSARKTGYANSADVAPSASFVGYVGVVF